MCGTDKTDRLRIDYLDSVKGLCIILIVWGHVSYVENIFMNMIAGFKIVAFI